MWEVVAAMAGAMAAAQTAAPIKPAEPPSTDCKGCGAPLKAYIHHCEYCRRPN